MLVGGAGGGSSGGAAVPLIALPRAAPPNPIAIPSAALTPVRQGVAHDDRDAEPVREGGAETGARAEFVGVGAVAVVPSPHMELEAAPSAPLRAERQRREREQLNRDELSPPRQRRLAPGTDVAPCDGTGDGALAA